MVRIEDISERVYLYNQSADLDIIKRAYVFSAMVHEGQTRMSGEPYLSHPLEVAYLLADLEMDPTTVATGLLHDTVEDTHTTIDRIQELFGEDIASLVDGLTKLGKITFNKKEDQEAENFRKMLIAMAKDIRVIVIKLADRLHNMRTIGALSIGRRIKIAGETLDVYAPLAHRLGLGWVKAELEELAFKSLQPIEYNNLNEKLAKGKDEREKYIAEVKCIIETKLAENSITGIVTGRAKHLYSINQKMREDDLDLEHIYDLVGLRIIVNSVKECYEALGIVHAEWKPIPGRFKDYIAIPKRNMYQSIHSTVMDLHGKRMEIQIRTHDMHRIDECGIAAHWKYKEGENFDDKVDSRFAWLRQLLEIQKEFSDPKEFMSTLKIDLFPDEVFVFTPQGDVKEFPKGANPIDFAYSIHTDIGNHCVGARVNGRIVNLKYKLKSGDRVDILTSKNQHPNKDWLKFAVTARAKTRIRQWIKTEEMEKSIDLGKMICEKAFEKYEMNLPKLLKSGQLDRVAKESFGLAGIDNLLANIGYGKLPVQQLLEKMVPKELLERDKRIWVSRFKKLFKRPKKEAREGVIVSGIDDIMVKFAKCCNPLSGDKIIGFITRGSGISVHTCDCPNMFDVDSDRIVDVEWAESFKTTRPTRIEVICVNETGLLKEISSAISSAKANILSANISTKDKKSIGIFEIEVTDLGHLKTIMGNIRNIKQVITVERLWGESDLSGIRRGYDGLQAYNHNG